ncbi:PREDICTED: chymotrypsin inhibitor-like [Vollenhovia emeryi]|uniref:chymotrypsin inhibitor-like n=1 Tax=Vollenhovia emeryi TaxID=411798 RepID=UPI0005F4B853|nr:PREDICTED: chymotrypsin inhibitor-like [Vollenhovia emeryi]
MSRASLVLLVMIGVFCSTTIAQRRCPRNQEWTNCGSACQPTCNSPQPQACTMQCIIGCQCRQGFLLHSSGACVSPSDC